MSTSSASSTTSRSGTTIASSPGCSAIRTPTTTRARCRRGRDVGVWRMTAGPGVHIPVLTAEVLRQLQPERGGLFVDCTVGLGGHSRALLESGATRIIGLDRDEAALPQAP